MASKGNSEVPCGFKEQLNKMLRAVLLNRPTQLNQFFAEFLEAELDRRTLCDLQLGRNTIRRDVGDSAAICRDSGISKTEAAAEKVSEEVIKRASKKKTARPKSEGKQLQKRPVKTTHPSVRPPRKPPTSEISPEDVAKQVSVDLEVPPAKRESTKDADRKSAEEPHRKSKKDATRKSTKAVKRKSTEDSKLDKDATYFEDYFLSPKPDGPIFVPETDETERALIEEHVFVTEIWNQMENPEQDAAEPEILQTPQFSISDVKVLTQELSGEKDGSKEEEPGDEGLPGRQEDRGVDDGVPSFHGFEEEQKVIDEREPVESPVALQGYVGEPSAGTESGQEPPVFPDQDFEQEIHPDIETDVQESEPGGEDTEGDKGFKQEPGDEEESFLSIEEVQDLEEAAITGEATMTPGGTTETAGGPSEVTETEKVPTIVIEMDQEKLEDFDLLIGETTMAKEKADERSKSSVDEFTSPTPSIGVDEVVHPSKAVAAAFAAAKGQQGEEDVEDKDTEKKDGLDYEAMGLAPRDFEVSPHEGETEHEEEEEELSAEEEEEVTDQSTATAEEDHSEDGTSDGTAPAHKEGLLSPRSAATSKHKNKKSKTEAHEQLSGFGSEASFTRILPSNEEATTSTVRQDSAIFMSEKSFPFLRLDSTHRDLPSVTITVTSPPHANQPHANQPQQAPPTQPNELANKSGKEQKNPGAVKAASGSNATPQKPPEQLITVDGVLEQVMVVENTMEVPQPSSMEQTVTS